MILMARLIYRYTWHITMFTTHKRLRLSPLMQADSGQIASESRKIDAECKVRGDVLTIKLKESVRFRTVTIIEKF